MIEKDSDSDFEIDRNAIRNEKNIKNHQKLNDKDNDNNNNNNDSNDNEYQFKTVFRDKKTG